MLGHFFSRWLGSKNLFRFALVSSIMHSWPDWQHCGGILLGEVGGDGEVHQLDITRCCAPLSPLEMGGDERAQPTVLPTLDHPLSGREVNQLTMPHCSQSITYIMQPKFSFLHFFSSRCWQWKSIYEGLEESKSPKVSLDEMCTDSSMGGENNVTRNCGSISGQTGNRCHVTLTRKGQHWSRINWAAFSFAWRDAFEMGRRDVSKLAIDELAHALPLRKHS